MDSFRFITKYPEYLQMIKEVTKEEYHPVITKMESWDPHDLITPETWFPSEDSSIGFVYRLFLNEVGEVGG